MSKAEVKSQWHCRYCKDREIVCVVVVQAAKAPVIATDGKPGEHDEGKYAGRREVYEREPFEIAEASDAADDENVQRDSLHEVGKQRERESLV